MISLNTFLAFDTQKKIAQVTINRWHHSAETSNTLVFWHYEIPQESACRRCLLDPLFLPFFPLLVQILTNTCQVLCLNFVELVGVGLHHQQGGRLPIKERCARLR